MAGFCMAAVSDLYTGAWNALLVQLTMVAVNMALIIFWKKQ